MMFLETLKALSKALLLDKLTKRTMSLILDVGL